MKTDNVLISIVVIIIALVPVLYKSSLVPLNTFDEARRAVNAAEMLENENYLVPYYDGKPDFWGTKPSLLVSLQAFSMNYLGVNRLAARLPSFIAILCLYIFIIYSAHGLGYLRSGWLAVIMLSTSPGFINNHGARSADYEALLGLFTTLMVIYYYKYLHAEDSYLNSKYFFITVFTLILACLTKGIAGLMLLPGIFLFTLLKGKLSKVLQDWRLWTGVVSFLLVIGGYYFLRWIQHPEYLQMVWDNEVGGRYSQTLEAHAHPWHYYITMLFKSYFVPWIFFVPVLFYVWSKQSNFFTYLSVVILTYLCILSFAETKIRWYIYPVLPFLAFLIAPCLIAVVQFVSTRLKALKNLSHPISYMTCFIIIFSIPYYSVLKDINRRLSKDLEEGYIAYGHFIDGNVDLMDNTYIASIGYRPNVLFQVKRMEAKGIMTKRIFDNKALLSGQKILICDKASYSVLPQKYELIERDEYCLLIRVE